MSKTPNPAVDNVKLDVRAYLIKDPQYSTLAFASVTINDTVAINGIRVVDGERGKFVSMPQTQDAEGEYRDIAFPVMKGLRPRINKEVMEAFDAAVQEKAQEKPSVAEQVKAGAERAKATPKRDKTEKAAAKNEQAL